jgi:hypothetical protein
MKDRLDTDIKGFEETLAKFRDQYKLVEGALQYAKALRSTLDTDRSSDDSSE